MLPIILVFGAFALVMMASGKAEARTQVPGRLPEPQPVPALPTPTEPTAPTEPPTRIQKCSEEEKAYVANVVSTISKGTASLEMMRKALAIAQRCFPQTAIAIQAALDKTLQAARARAETDPQKQLAALIAAPDAPASPVPLDPSSGKTIWKIKTSKGEPIAIPNFSPVLNLFKHLQSLVGAEQDGRIGPETVVKFRNMMSKKGYKSFPQNAPTLAANVSKYIAVLTQNTPSTQVGAHGGSGLQPPFPGC